MTFSAQCQERLDLVDWFIQKAHLLTIGKNMVKTVGLDSECWKDRRILCTSTQTVSKQIFSSIITLKAGVAIATEQKLGFGACKLENKYKYTVW